MARFEGNTIVTPFTWRISKTKNKLTKVEFKISEWNGGSGGGGSLLCQGSCPSQGTYPIGSGNV